MERIDIEKVFIFLEKHFFPHVMRAYSVNKIFQRIGNVSSNNTRSKIDVYFEVDLFLEHFINTARFVIIRSIFKH